MEDELPWGLLALMLAIVGNTAGVDDQSKGPFSPLVGMFSSIHVSVASEGFARR